MDEREDKDEFVVRDRRRFTTEGESKSGEKAESKVEETPKPEPVSESQSAQEKTEEPEFQKPLDFIGFVVSLANTAIIQMGLIPDTENRKDLVGAKQTIDLIALIEEKTRGNLSEQEQKILKESLFQLRMAFVEVSK